jgi:hypothetical protein
MSRRDARDVVSRKKSDDRINIDSMELRLGFLIREF